jgi:hypothetical protein
VFAFLRARSLRRGFFGGSRGWFAVGVVVWGARLMRRLVGRRPEVVAVEKVDPGRSVTVSSVERRRRGPSA